jgi:hypothetical protein
LTKDANEIPYSLSSGHIGDKVIPLLFSIASGDRVAGKSGVSVTFAFVPSIGGRLVDGTKIFLSIPFGFFASSSMPVYYHSTTLIRSTVSLANQLIEIKMAGTGAIMGNRSFCITLRGMVMGAVTSGNATGVSVKTSQVRNVNHIHSACRYEPL